MTDLQEKAIKEFLEENVSERLSICKDINSYDGSMDFSESYNLEELCEMTKTADIVMAVIYGNVEGFFDYVRYNAYGNLETVYQSDLEEESESYIDKIIDFIESNGTQYINSAEIDDILNNDDYKYICSICGCEYDTEEEKEECERDCKKLNKNL